MKTKIGSMFLLAAILVAGTITMIIPKSLAEPEYYGYEEKYAKDPYEKKYSFEDKKYPMEKEHDKYSKGASVQSIKCVNANVNINGVEVKKHVRGMGADEAATTPEAQQFTGDNSQRNGLFDGINIDKNLVNVCININANEQVDVDPKNKKTCEDCFKKILTPEELERFLQYLASLPDTAANNLQEYCELIKSLNDEGQSLEQIRAAMLNDFEAADISEAQLDKVIKCLIKVGTITVDGRGPGR